MSIAPNRLDVVHAVIAAHPEINRLSDGPFAPNRGGITQLVAQQLGFPFGRKSRDQSQTNLSDDALCYRLQDNRFEIYDILSGGDGSGQWNYVGTFADGENGFFVSVSAAPQPDPKPGPVTPPPPPGLDEAAIRRIVQDELAKPRRVAIKSSRGRYLRDDWGDDTGKFDRAVAADGETYTLEPK